MSRLLAVVREEPNPTAETPVDFALISTKQRKDLLQIQLSGSYGPKLETSCRVFGRFRYYLPVLFLNRYCPGHQTDVGCARNKQ